MEMTLCLLDGEGVCVESSNLELYTGAESGGSRHSKIFGMNGQILGNGMSNKMWEGTVEHAKTCVLSGKLHVYYADEKQNIGVIFNNIFQLMGLIADGAYMSVDSLSDSEKVIFC